MPILGLIVCGAPLAARTRDLADAADRAGWDVSLVPTEAAMPWFESSDDAQDHHTEFRRPDEPKRQRPDALIVCPLTFNSASKWVLGIADNHAMSLLCESLGSGLPILAVPMVNDSLWRHPAWTGHLELLTAGGVVMLDPATGAPGARSVRSGTGDDITKNFDPMWVLSTLARLRGTTPS